MSDTIKSCPFCGSTAPDVHPSHVIGRIFCECCGADGPWAPHFDGDWNTRAPTPAPTAMGWEPIETAPKDGREVLMYSPENGMAVWSSHAGWHHVTHWMPLPAAPADYEARIISAFEDHPADEVQRLTAERDAALRREAALKASIEDDRQALRSLNAERDALRAENDRHARQLAEAQAELAHFRKEVEETWKANANDADARAEKAEAEVARLNAENAMIAIKPLVWESYDPGYHSWKAPLFGAIAIKQHWKGHWCVVWSTPGYTELFIPGQFGTLDDAKAAAQAIITARILSALTTDATAALAALEQEAGRE